MSGIARNGDVSIGWTSTGDGPPVVLIQGLGYPKEGWEPIVADLADHLRVITFDNRGIGSSSIPPGPYSAAMMADDVVAVLDDADVDRAHMVGISLGGMIAQELAIEHAARVDRMVLIATSPGAPLGLPMPTPTAELIAQAATGTVGMPRLVANALGPDTDPSVRDRIVALRSAAPPDPAGWAAQAAAGTTYTGGDRIGTITAPTLVIAGDHDPVIDPGNAELLGRLIPGARVEILAGVGHLPPWEAPRATARSIIEFLL